MTYIPPELTNEIISYLRLNDYLNTRLVFKDHPGNRISDLLDRKYNYDDLEYLKGIGCKNSYTNDFKNHEEVIKKTKDLKEDVFHSKISLCLMFIFLSILVIAIPLIIYGMTVVTKNREPVLNRYDCDVINCSKHTIEECGRGSCTTKTYFDFDISVKDCRVRASSFITCPTSIPCFYNPDKICETLSQVDDPSRYTLWITLLSFGLVFIFFISIPLLWIIYCNISIIKKYRHGPVTRDFYSNNMSDLSAGKKLFTSVFLQ
jgi:hypothetical protein